MCLECNINIATAFFWRHKILDALSSFMGTGEVDGLVEADECYLRYSYKGNHSKSKRFTMHETLVNMVESLLGNVDYQMNKFALELL